MIEDIYQGHDVSSRYHALEPTKKMVACMITCARLANQLDNCKPDMPPESLKFVGRFLQKVDHENALVAVRSQIQVERIVKFNLDEHDDWQSLHAISKKVSGQP
jgi:hypothetical protein